MEIGYLEKDIRNKRKIKKKISCWRRLEKIIWTDHVRNEEVLHLVKKERNILVQETEGRLIGLVTHFIGKVL